MIDRNSKSDSQRPGRTITTRLCFALSLLLLCSKIEIEFFPSLSRSVRVEMETSIDILCSTDVAFSLHADPNRISVGLPFFSVETNRQEKGKEKRVGSERRKEKGEREARVPERWKCSLIGEIVSVVVVFFLAEQSKVKQGEGEEHPSVWDNNEQEKLTSRERCSFSNCSFSSLRVRLSLFLPRREETRCLCIV